MQSLKHLFDNNQAWAERIKQQDPEFFLKLSRQQSPKYLWIGCSDSRVPANEIVGLRPGELFVHRNIANLVVHTDLNCLSVIQYAVDALKVSHIIVVGHYGCGGVQAAARGKRVGLSDHWLRHIQDVRHKHADDMADAGDETTACSRLCELSVIEQAMNVCQTTIVRDAWASGQELAVHGWIYSLKDGLAQDLGFTATGSHETLAVYQSSLDSLRASWGKQA